MDEPPSSLNLREILLKYAPSVYVSKEKCVTHRADKIIAVSNNTRRDIAMSYGIAEDKIVVVKNGIDIDLFSPTRKFKEVFDQSSFLSFYKLPNSAVGNRSRKCHHRPRTDNILFVYDSGNTKILLRNRQVRTLVKHGGEK